MKNSPRILHHSPFHRFRLYMNAAAVFFVFMAAGLLAAISYVVYRILHLDQVRTPLSILWILAVWTVLSLVAAAWCRMQALRADALSTETDPPTPTQITELLEKGLEQWTTEELKAKAPTSSSSSTE